MKVGKKDFFCAMGGLIIGTGLYGVYRWETSPTKCFCVEGLALAVLAGGINVVVGSWFVWKGLRREKEK